MENQSLAPIEVRALMHFYARCEPLDEGGNIRDEMVQRFLDLKAIEPCEYGYKTTPLGDAWVKAILGVPVPKLAFIDEQGRVL